ncbi:LPS assembly protein LptD [Thauera sp. 2A1]|uniref:LPS-assembly protein LptD n=1 Tax=Thauera sp. 2A1 TaxID=2570191 RepID=UPI0027E3EFE7|nr:LPS assembly protein LptD [Thauera sp. 2A1]
MSEKVLNTRLRAIPLLLFWMSGAFGAADMPALVVSPDLVRGGASATPSQPAPQPAASPGPAVAGTGTASAGLPAVGVDARSLKTPPAKAADGSARERVSSTPSAPVAKEAAPGARAGSGTSGIVAAPAPASPSEALAPGATSITALRLRGTRTVELVAEGEAELQRDDVLLTADKVTYREVSDQAIADGNVRLKRDTALVTGPHAELIVGEQVGAFDSPSYSMTREREADEPGGPARAVSGSGHADLMNLEGENHYRLTNATWSTCQASDPDWYIKARDLELDYDREVGTARGASLVFMDTPILWMPWADFPLVAQRQSGFLPPTFGVSTKTGVDLSVPYYWNIAPNYDATIAPHLMSKRGMQLAGEFRYLGDTYRGESRVEWLPQDSMLGKERALGSFQHQQWLTPTLYGALDVNAVSDDQYFQDLSSRIVMSSRVNLLRQGQLVYTGGGWWTASALMQAYQTLNPDPAVRNASPYRRLPQLKLDAFRPDLPAGLTFAFNSEYVRFEGPENNQVDGTRVTAYPQVSLPIRGAAYFLTPKVGIHQTTYDLQRPQDVAGERNSITRTMPIFSIDSGLFFERDTTLFGSDFTQTLEPRLYYLNVPYRRQDDIPLFDTSRYDFGFAQIFSENRYTGGDRIGDANDLTAAVTSRLIDPATGAERIRALVGQRYYFEDQRVTAGEVARTSRRADILGGLNGRLTRTTSVDSLLQYNPNDSQIERFNAALRYQPEFAKALNVSYRYARDLRSTDGTLGLRDVDVSGQWPLWNNWYGVGRVTHSLKEDRVTEAIGGLEFNGGCWVFRAAVHRYALTADKSNKALFFQLEFNDLTSIGSSPLALIKRSVPGYGKINDPTANRVFGY